MELVAADAASLKVSNVDRDVESPINQETHIPNDIPFTPDTATHYYKATTTGSVLKKSKKGRKKMPRLFCKISWKKKAKGGNTVDAKCDKIQNEGRKEVKVGNNNKNKDTAEGHETNKSQEQHDSKSINDNNPSSQPERQASHISSSRSPSQVRVADHGSMASKAGSKTNSNASGSGDGSSVKSNASINAGSKARNKSCARNDSVVANSETKGSAVSSKKSLEKLFSDALAVSVTPKEAAQYLQTQDPAFQCSEEGGSITKMLERSKYMNKDIKADDKDDPGLILPPVTSFEECDTRSTTSTVTNISAGSVKGILIKKNFTMMSAVTTEVANHDPQINEQEANLENDVSLKESAMPDLDEDAAINPSNGDDESAIEYDCDAIAANLYGDEASKRSTPSEKSTNSTKSTKNKRSMLVCLSVGNDGAEKAEEMDESVQPSDGRNKSNANNGISKVGRQVDSQVSRQVSSQVHRSNINGSMPLISNAGATSKVIADSKISPNSNRSESCTGRHGDHAEIQVFWGAGRDPSEDYASNKVQSNTNVGEVDNIVKASTSGFACGMGGLTRDIMADVKTLVKKAALNIALTREVEVAYNINSFEHPLLEGISSSSSTLSDKKPTESYPQENNADSRHDLSSTLSWSDLAHGQKKSCLACYSPIKQNDSIISWKDM